MFVPPRSACCNLTQRFLFAVDLRLEVLFRPFSFMYTDWVMKKTQEVTATLKKNKKINVKVNFYEVNMYIHLMGTQMYKIKHISLIYLRWTQIKESRF